MATDTHIILRSRLDANQRDREQMCRAILALDVHYADVRPHHPSGGPDGGRDIEAIVDGEIGHFRAFVDITLRAIKDDILTICFGSSALPGRFNLKYGPPYRLRSPGIANGIASGQWEHHVRLKPDETGEDGPSGKGEGIGTRRQASGSFLRARSMPADERLGGPAMRPRRVPRRS